QIGFVHSEGNVGGGRAGVAADVLDDHVYVDGGVGEGVEDTGGHAGFVWHADDGHFGLIFIEGDAANDDVLHAGGFFFHNRSWVVIQTCADFEHDAEFFSELDRPGLHDFGA